MINLDAPCPCMSGNSYKRCCQPLHAGEIPKNALELMRSRYTAYVLNLPDYLIRTTHPASPQYMENRELWKQKISNMAVHSSFEGLEILEFKEKGSIATVTFTCRLMQGGEDATFTEKSYFELFKGRWLYRIGQFKDTNNPGVLVSHELNLLPLTYYDDQILRKKAAPIIEMTSEINNLAESMIATMDACDGLGLAAPQINQSIRLFVIRTPIEKGDDKFELGDPQVFINPQLSEPSSESWAVQEACLSIPTIRSLVERPRQITIEYTMLDGSRTKKRVSNWESRVIMHENDHLNGVLFIDRISQKEKEKLKAHLVKLNERIHPA